MVEKDHTEVVDIDHTAMVETTHYRGGRENIQIQTIIILRTNHFINKEYNKNNNTTPSS